MCSYLNVYDAYLFLEIGGWEQKHRVPDTYYINNDHASVIKFMKVTSNSTQRKKRRITKN